MIFDQNEQKQNMVNLNILSDDTTNMVFVLFIKAFLWLKVTDIEL